VKKAISAKAYYKNKFGVKKSTRSNDKTGKQD